MARAWRPVAGALEAIPAARLYTPADRPRPHQQTTDSRSTARPRYSPHSTCQWACCSQRLGSLPARGRTSTECTCTRADSSSSSSRSQSPVNIPTPHTHTHTHTHTTLVSQYQKGETNLDSTEAIDSEWQWHQLRYDTRCYFIVRSKADMSRINLPHRNDNKNCKTEKLKSKKQLILEVTVKSGESCSQF